MRIALINENSQAAKNEMVYNTLKKVAESKGHTVDNYGMYAADDAAQLTYVQNGRVVPVCFAAHTGSVPCWKKANSYPIDRPVCHR